MQIVPISDVPSQTLRSQLGAQACTINVYQKSTGLYCDVYVADVLVIGGVICENANRIVRDPYLGLAGDLLFLDTHGTSDPATPGLGSRFVLFYLNPSDVAAGLAASAASMVTASTVFALMAVPPQPSSALFARGVFSSAGVASLTTSTALAAFGSTQSAGTALLAASFSGTGIVVSGGAAALTIGLALSASGKILSTGAGSLGNSLALSATGTDGSIGSAALGLSRLLAGSGVDSANGAATLALSTALAGRGIVVATGSVTFGASIALSAAGLIVSLGTGVLTP